MESKNLPVEFDQKFEGSDAYKLKNVEFEQDERTKIAQEDIFEKYPSGAIRIFKTPRAGATTSLCVASIDRHEQVLIVLPTNNIGDITVAKGVQKLRPKAKIVSVKANKFCLRNQEKIAKCPRLDDLELMTIPGGCKKYGCGRTPDTCDKICEECNKKPRTCNENCDLCNDDPHDCGKECKHFEICPVTEVLRHPDADVIIITSDKLFGLIISSSLVDIYNDYVERRDIELLNTPLDKEILNILLSVKNVVFDEAHWMQEVVPSKVQISHGIDGIFQDIDYYTKYLPILNEHVIRLIEKTKISKSGRKYTDIEIDFAPISDKYERNEIITKVILKFCQVLNDKVTSEKDVISKSIEKLKEKSKNRRKFDEPLVANHSNPSYTWKLEQERKTFIGRLISELTTMIELDQDIDKYSLKVNPDLNDLFKMASVVTANKVQLSAIKHGKSISIDISAANKLILEMVMYFICFMMAKGDKRIILTTATFGSFNYNTLLDNGNKFIDVMFGENGDPLYTNEKMLLIADTKTLSFTRGKYSAKAQLPIIVHKICRWLDELGDNCFIIAPTIDLAKLYKKAIYDVGRDIEVTYYRSSETIGVNSECRTAIVICAAHIPTHSYDYIVDEDDDEKESLIRRQEDVDTATYQAISRVKDPNGKSPSVVYFFGVPEDQVSNLATWGMDRKVSIAKNGRGKRNKIQITCSSYIAKPKIIQCEDFTVALDEAKKHMYGVKSLDGAIEENKIKTGLPSSEIQNTTIKNTSGADTRQLELHINNIICSSNCTRVSHVDLLNLILKGALIGASDSGITKSKANWHMQGKVLQKTKIVSKDNNVHWIQFQDIRFIHDLNRMLKYLQTSNISRFVENNLTDNTYTVWILVNPIEGLKAKKFGEQVIRDIVKDGEEFHCVLIPKYTHQKGTKFKKNNEIKLPLHPKSRILVDGKFKQTFESLDIGVLDVEKFVNENVPELVKEYKRMDDLKRLPPEKPKSKSKTITVSDNKLFKDLIDSINSKKSISHVAGHVEQEVT
jgi:hypothetical protein